MDENAPLDPRNAYASSKVAQEYYSANWARVTGGSVAALRYHNVYGPGMPRDTPYAGVAAIFTSALKRGEAPKVFEDGRQRRDFVHVRDVAAATVLACEQHQDGVRAFNVGSGTPRTVGDMAAALARSLKGPAAGRDRTISSWRRAAHHGRFLAAARRIRLAAAGRVCRRHGRTGAAMSMPFPPPQSCDCHVHVVGPKARFPLPRERRYTPSDAPAAELAAMLERLGLTRVVIIQPSFYGTDNSCVLDALAQLDNARGVAVLPEQVPEAELDALDEQGIRGLRINIASAGSASPDAIIRAVQAAAKLCEPHGWHVQMFVAADAIAPLAPVLHDLPVNSVFDHFGLIAPGAANGALRALTGLLETGKVWVKISGAYRISDDPNDPRIDPLARTLCEANPERIVWGSDWPHTPPNDLQKPAR